MATNYQTQMHQGETTVDTITIGGNSYLDVSASYDGINVIAVLGGAFTINSSTSNYRNLLLFRTEMDAYTKTFNARIFNTSSSDAVVGFKFQYLYTD